MPDFVVRSADLHGLPPGIDGVLGIDFFRRFVMELDLDGAVLFHDRAEFQRPDPPITLQLGQRGYYVIPGSFDALSRKNIEGMFFLDTGSAYDVAWPADEEVLRELPRQTVPASTAGGAAEVYLYMLPRFRFAGRTHSNINLMPLPKDCKRCTNRILDERGGTLSAPTARRR